MKINFLYAILIALFVSCESGAQNNGDRATFDLKGKAVVSDPSLREFSNTALATMAEFSADGKLLSMRGMDMTQANGSYSITRNDNGQIESITSEEGEDEKTVTYRYNKNGQVEGFSVLFVNGDTDEETLAWEVTRKFGTNGQVVSEDFKGSDGTTMHYTYSYVKIDEQGNWVERLVSESTQNICNEKETRVIKYK